MRLFILIAVFSGLSLSMYSQFVYDEPYNNSTNNPVEEPIEKRNSITIGFLQGGGSLIGADIESLVTNRFGVQAGFGFLGFGAGLNYHFKPSIRSSFVSFQYWHQGFGDSYTQSILGPSFVFRGKKWFTFQIGAGVPLEKGPALPYDYVQPPIMLLYAIGAYIPLSI